MKTKHASRFVCLAAMVWICSATVAMASSPLPDNGTFNAVTRTVLLDYNTAPYTHAVVTGFPNKGYADVWVNSAYKKITTPAEANALLMARRTSNATIRVRVLHKDIDVSGRALVRHGLGLSYPSKTRTRFVVRGAVLPKSRHSVQVSIQKRIFGVWITRQKQTVKSGSTGRFKATFTARRYYGTYRVRAYVPSDKYNYSGTAHRNR